MKKLYVSDLDCTLMNQKQELTQNSVEALNNAIANGVSLSIATGRGKSAIEKLQDVKLNLPIIMLNGSIIYDQKLDKFVRVKNLSVKQSKEFFKFAYSSGDDSVLFHILKDNEIQEYMLDECPPAIKELRTKNHKSIKFIKYEEVDRFLDNNVVLFMQFKSSLLRIKVTESLLKAVQYEKNLGGRILFHNDEYNKDIGFLDVYPDGADKSDAVNYIKELYGFDYITAFGDSNNDLSFRTVADRLVVVSNSVTELKDKADLVIGSCNEDSVANFILKESTYDN